MGSHPNNTAPADRDHLLGISKRGDVYLRTLMHSQGLSQNVAAVACSTRQHAPLTYQQTIIDPELIQATHRNPKGS